jgi:RNA polymerase sigma factor (sigma-70 family)
VNKKHIFAKIYERERRSITGFGYARTWSWVLAEDITADVFADVWEQRDRLWDDFWHDQALQHAFLMTVARRRIAKHWSEQRRKRAPVTFAEYFAVVPDDEDIALADDGGIEAIIEACDTAMAAALLEAALKHCTPTQLQIVQMRYVQNLTPAATASRLGLTRVQFMERHQRLLGHLSTLFGAQDGAA